MRRGASLLVAAFVVLALGASTAVADTVVFQPIASNEPYTVPNGIFTVHVVAVGGRGGDGFGGATGGFGAVASGDVPVFPGQILHAQVGTNGVDYGECCYPSFPNGGIGGLGAMGNHGAAGGGATRLQIGPVVSDVADIVAAGGGGAGGGHPGHPGGNGGDADHDGGRCASANCGFPGRINGIDGLGTGNANPGQGGNGGALLGASGGGGGGGGGGIGSRGTPTSGGGGGSADAGPDDMGGGGAGGTSSSQAPLAIDRTGRGSLTLTTLTGQAEPSAVTLDFGHRLRGMARLKAITVASRGAGRLNVATATVTGAARRDFAPLIACAGDDTIARHVVERGQSCEVRVRFTPSRLGPRRATLTIATNDPRGPIVVPLSGIGVPRHPRLSGLRLTRSTFAAGSRVVISYQAVTAAHTRLRVFDARTGRAVGAAFFHRDRVGANRVAFRGRVHRNRHVVALAPGRYRLRAVARNESGTARAVTPTFRIVSRR